MKLFDFDNPVWSACSKVFDLILLNIIFILCCIPVITIGPAITLLYNIADDIRAIVVCCSGILEIFQRKFKAGNAYWNYCI